MVSSHKPFALIRPPQEIRYPCTMPEQQRRAPPSMPAGATTLSERIAALQRKASDSQHRTASPHMVRASSANSSSSSATSPAWAPSSTRFSQPPQAVKDRIARFQPSAADLSERPLVPRSSFGAPAPNPDNSGRVLRPYPGASIPGGGSGNWGEGVLRPQMTGSAWLGTGGGPRSPGLKPQMTGPNWSRRQSEQRVSMWYHVRLRSSLNICASASLGTMPL